MEKLMEKLKILTQVSLDFLGHKEIGK